MANVLKNEKQEQIRSLGRLGWSLRRIEEATGVRRETVGSYLRAAGILVREERHRRLGSDSKAASEVTTDPATGSKAASAVTTDLERGGQADGALGKSQCEPHRDSISEAVGLGRNVRSIWQDLVTDHGYRGSYESVKRFVRKLRGTVSREAHPTITTEPGEEAQVDYGTGPMVRHPETGKYRRTRLFALTLGYSRKSVWLLAFKSSSRVWCELHEEAFRRLGGLPRIVVLDNLKEGVIKPDAYDPELNPLFKGVLKHYGVTAVPARVRHPDRKGKVERAVGHAQDTALHGKRFESLEEAQAHLDSWSARWADTRIHGTTKRQVAAMFAEERPALQPLPAQPFRYFQYGSRTVHLDGCIEVEAAYYGAPPGWIGQRVHVQWDERYVRLIHPKTGDLLRESRVQPRGRRFVHKEDQPSTAPASTLGLLDKAKRAGPSVGAVCLEIHTRRKEAGVRQILGVLSLVKKHGATAVGEASDVALEVGVPTYQFLRKWLEKHPPVPISLRQVDPLIRELTEYRDLINNVTETNS